MVETDLHTAARAGLRQVLTLLPEVKTGLDTASKVEMGRHTAPRVKTGLHTAARLRQDVTLLIGLREG
jgi:hypothetical protein